MWSSGFIFEAYICAGTVHDAGPCTVWAVTLIIGVGVFALAIQLWHFSQPTC